MVEEIPTVSFISNSNIWTLVAISDCNNMMMNYDCDQLCLLILFWKLCICTGFVKYFYYTSVVALYILLEYECTERITEKFRKYTAGEQARGSPVVRGLPLANECLVRQW